MPYARRDTIQWLPGHFYHIYNRGAHRLTIFREPENYYFMLGKMKKYMMQFNITVIAYVLMPNHYHLLLRQNGEIPAGMLPQHIFNSYTKAFNRSDEHSGTLFEGRFKAIPVVEENYLLHLCRYIHANPVVHGIVEHLEEWPYSNYPEWMALRQGRIVDREFVKLYFDSKESYAAFVREYIIHRQHPDGLAYLEALS